MKTNLKPARGANETFDQYKTRRAAGNAEVKAHRRGEFFYSFADKANQKYDPVLDIVSGIPYRKAA